MIICSQMNIISKTITSGTITFFETAKMVEHLYRVITQSLPAQKINMLGGHWPLTIVDWKTIGRQNRSTRWFCICLVFSIMDLVAVSILVSALPLPCLGKDIFWRRKSGSLSEFGIHYRHTCTVRANDNDWKKDAEHSLALVFRHYHCAMIPTPEHARHIIFASHCKILSLKWVYVWIMRRVLES